MNSSYVSDYWATVVGNTFLRILLLIAAIILTQLVIRSLIQIIVKNTVRASDYSKKADEIKCENTLIAIFRTASALLIWLVGIIAILSQLHIHLAALATGAGLFSVIIGFGAQNIIKDVLSGIFIILENQYRVGDIVSFNSIGGIVSGLVEDITIRITRLRDLDGNVHIIQNGSISIVTNLSFDYANVNVDVRVAYDTNIDTVEHLINEIGTSLQKHATLGEFIIEPITFLRVDGFEESAVRVKALGKVEPGKQWDVAGEFRRELVVAFAKAKIEIPYAQLVIHQPAKDS